MIRRNVELSNIVTNTNLENLEQQCMKKNQYQMNTINYFDKNKIIEKSNVVYALYLSCF